MTIREGERKIIVRYLLEQMREIVGDKKEIDKTNYLSLYISDNLRNYLGKQICKLTEMEVDRGSGS